MADVRAPERPRTTVSVVYGQMHRFELIPIMAHNARFFPAGPVCFGIEGRVLGRRDGTIGEIGASLHVFNADRTEEWLRFDCFDRGPHYHYVHHREGHNTVWGFDRVANGPLLPWAIARIRTRLPEMLRQAGADALADEVARAGIDQAVVDEVHAAMIATDAAIRPGSIAAIEEGIDWMDRWKRLHPQFNTVDE